MCEGSGRGRGLPGPPASPCRRRLRASAPPKVKVTSSGQTCKRAIGVSTPVSRTEWGAPDPAQEAPYPRPTRPAPAGFSTPVLSRRHICAAARTARWRSQSLLHRIAPFPLSRTQANGAGGLTGTAHLERQNKFAIAGPEQGLSRVHCKNVAAGWSLAACNAIIIMQRRD